MNLTKIEAGWARLLELAAMAMMLGLVVVVTWAVLGRQLFRLPVAWSEEIGAGMLAWMVLLGSAAAWYHRRHLVIDLVLRRLSRRWLLYFSVIIEIGSLILLIVAFWGAWSMMSVSANNTTTALQISFSWLYLALVIGLGSMILFGLIHLGRMLIYGEKILRHYDTDVEWNT